MLNTHRLLPHYHRLPFYAALKITQVEVFKLSQTTTLWMLHKSGVESLKAHWQWRQMVEW
jgi:hypothetical protein